ncbi:MAG: hypothetical protein U0232_28725 [Thermomicrobiales bacterium]
MQQPGPPQRAAAEFVGTFGLVFAGCGAVVVDTTTGGGDHPRRRRLTFGLIIATMIYACRPHLRRALQPRRHPRLRRHRHPLIVPAYLATQFGGAIAASVVLRLLFGNVTNLGTTLPAGGINNRSPSKRS